MRDSISWATRTAVNKKSVIEFYRKSGRHRSVGISTITSYLLKSLSFEVNLVRQSAWTWREMRCGGQCSRCHFADSRDNEELMKPWVRKFNLEIASERQARIEQDLEGDATVATWRHHPLEFEGRLLGHLLRGFLRWRQELESLCLWCQGQRVHRAQRSLLSGRPLFRHGRVRGWWKWLKEVVISQL